MKKLIFLLLVISVTAVTAQNYQYFTAKQGIPKALEIAKQYFHSDSVELYEIMCVRSYFDSWWMEHIDEDIIPYNDTTGKSLFWYYKFCVNNDSCVFIRIKKYLDNFIADTLWKSNLSQYDDKRPIILDSILIDSDSLVESYEMCGLTTRIQLIFFHLCYYPYYLDNCRYVIGFESDLVWSWHWKDIGGMGAYSIDISAKSGKCCESSLDVFEKNNNNSKVIIKSDPNTDNIIIETNSDLFREAELSLFDQVGVLLFADKLNNKSYQLSTYNYPTGLYILQIRYGGNIITKTVMVVH